jgi:regulation of enolase protein 1 (concanavalin A-like superfamily)
MTWLPDGFQDAAWLNQPSAWTAADGSLTITAAARTDWSNEALTGVRQASAPALLVERSGDFALSACVHVGFGSTFDAGDIALWLDESTWAKLCFEYSPQGQPMVVSVVTRGFSDDVNSVPVDGNSVWLRVSRIGAAYLFSYSTDGSFWYFVRLFRLGDESAARVGFLAQAPMGDGCMATFSDIRWSAPPADLRDGT